MYKLRLLRELYFCILILILFFSINEPDISPESDYVQTLQKFVWSMCMH